MLMEKVYRFGPEESLLGVLTEPETRAPENRAPENRASVQEPAAQATTAVLWLNAGMVHHIGPFGWYVTLGRRLADKGFLSFRIDLSGVGESPHRSAPTWRQRNGPPRTSWPPWTF